MSASSDPANGVGRSWKMPSDRRLGVGVSMRPFSAASVGFRGALWHRVTLT